MLDTHYKSGLTNMVRLHTIEQWNARQLELRDMHLKTARQGYPNSPFMRAYYYQLSLNAHYRTVTGVTDKTLLLR